ncbi:MAG TPA: sialidase family protein, partial [Gemmataceae bacterium]
SVSLLRLDGGAIALVYLRKNSLTDCRPYLRVSKDEGKTWGPPKLVIAAPGYYIVNNDRVVRLSTGRLVVPAAHRGIVDNKRATRTTAQCYLSDDGGATWRPGRGDELQAPTESKSGLQEPLIVEMKNGNLFMLCRTDLGCQMRSDSSDGGETWSPARPTEIKSPLSPSSIRRIPKTGDLLMVWNDHSRVEPARRSLRTPLTVAISRDDGTTWMNTKTIEDDPEGWYCYTAIAFVGDRVLLGYCAGNKEIGRLCRTQITTFSLDWLYR